MVRPKTIGALVKGSECSSQAGGSISDLAYDNIQVPHLAIATDSSVSRLIPNRGDCVQGVPKPPSNGFNPCHWALKRPDSLSDELGVSSAFDGRLKHAKQNLRVAGSGRSDCRQSGAGCRKPFSVIPFAGKQPDKAPGTPTQPGTATRPVFE